MLSPCNIGRGGGEGINENRTNYYSSLTCGSFFRSEFESKQTARCSIIIAGFKRDGNVRVKVPYGPPKYNFFRKFSKKNVVCVARK